MRIIGPQYQLQQTNIHNQTDLFVYCQCWYKKLLGFLGSIFCIDVSLAQTEEKMEQEVVVSNQWNNADFQYLLCLTEPFWLVVISQLKLLLLIYSGCNCGCVKVCMFYCVRVNLISWCIFCRGETMRRRCMRCVFYCFCPIMVKGFVNLKKSRMCILVSHSCGVETSASLLLHLQC